MDAHQIAKLSVDNQRTWSSVLLVEALGSGLQTFLWVPACHFFPQSGRRPACILFIFLVYIPWIPFSSVSISTIEGFYAFDHGMKHIFCDQWQLVTTRIVSPSHSGLLS